MARSRKETLLENPSFKRLKFMQMSEKRNWKGVDCYYTSRPGTNTVLNRRTHSYKSEGEKKVEERFNLLHKILSSIRKVEETERLKLMQDQLPYQALAKATNAYMQLDEPHWSHNPPLYEMIKFKPIKESQLLREPAPVINFGKASPFSDS